MKYLITFTFLFIYTILLSQPNTCPKSIDNSPGGSGFVIRAYIYSYDNIIIDSILCNRTGNASLHIDCEWDINDYPNGSYILLIIPHPSGSTTDCIYNMVGAITGLPIELKLFEVRNKGIYNEIKWITLSERNNDYFTLERSSDGINWVTITTINGGGTTNYENTYVYNDYTFDKVINYYRLSQTDYDGTSEIFNIISIDNQYSKEVLKVVNFYRSRS